uniref:Uncharacterized protein n=1 Tax=viral metagenome TaxID=1070528 RepID=A0A6C0EAS0_9ZZZZ
MPEGMGGKETTFLSKEISPSDSNAYDPMVLNSQSVGNFDSLFDKMRKVDDVDMMGENTGNIDNISNQKLDDTLKEYVNVGRFDKGDESVKLYTDAELSKYRQDFFNFNDKINVESRNPYDGVDKINLMMLSNDGDVSKNKIGARISDVFGFLTNDGKQCGNPEFDPLLMTNQYKKNGANGKTFVRQNKIYCDEDVNNGGEFYSGIEGFDPLSDESLSLA